MKKLIQMFYESAEAKTSILNPFDVPYSVNAFNNPENTKTFIEVRFSHAADFYSVPFIHDLPRQPEPNTYDKLLFTRAFEAHYHDKLTWLQRAFFAFVFERQNGDTGRNFEEWLRVEERYFIENGKTFLGIDTIPEMLMGYVAESDAELFRKFWAGYQERMGI